MVNLLMGRLLRLFSRFEGHYSSTSVFIVMTCHRLVHKSAFAADDERETSVFRRLMILQFINTSCITVFSSSKFEALFGGTSKGLGDFDWHWYRDVGTDLIFIVWLQ